MSCTIPPSCCFCCYCWSDDERSSVMQYGKSGYSGGNQRLYTPSYGSRRDGGGRGVGALPDILWKASGVTTRPASGLRLTVKHVDVPQHAVSPGMPPLSRQRPPPCLSHSDPAGRPVQYRAPTTPRRGSLGDTRLLSRPQQSSASSAVSPSAHSSCAPKANRTMLPPLPAVASPAALTEEPPQALEDTERSSTVESDGDSSSLEESEEEEVYSDEEDESDNPPSRPGFESESEQNTQIFDAPFASVASPFAVFPATLLQDHCQLDMERFAASVLPSGLSGRVNNIVRAFSIHGPLDHSLLARALNCVASLHPILAATFQRVNDRLYMKIASGPLSISLESPIAGHERTGVLITNARRKPFPLPLNSDLVMECGGDGVKGGRVLSIVSLASRQSSDEDSSDDQCKRQQLLSLAKKSVTFGHVATLKETKKGTHDLRSPIATPTNSNETPTVLMRARLVRESVHNATLVLSFPRIICDYWSSCLFVQQLVDAYGQLERSSSHRPTVAVRRTLARKREIATRYGRSEKTLEQPRPATVGIRTRLLCGEGGDSYKPVVRAQTSFQQVALRERQLLRFLSKEKLWGFWDSMVTAVIKRQRGPNRVKVVPPVRIPSGLGEKVSRVRPQTSRLRPLTGRSRPQTGRKMAGESDRHTLSGPKTDSHFIKFEEEVCAAFRLAFPEEHQVSVRDEDLLSLACLGSFVLLLGRCCRGWGEEERGGRGRGRGEGDVSFLQTSRAVYDPLQQYKLNRGPRSHDPPPRSHDAPPRSHDPFPRSHDPFPRSHDPFPRSHDPFPRSHDPPPRSHDLPPPIVIPQETRQPRRAAMTSRLDLGTFLVGVEVSLRHSHPRHTQGLFGPLTNDVGIRVSLSSCETFTDLLLALGKTLQSVRNHHHFPFTTVTEELGIPAGLPVRFSYLYRSDILQLTDSANFYFPETAVGIKGHGLTRLGSACYLSPLSTKLGDSRHLELCLWEGYDSDSVGGVFLYQPHIIRRDLVEAMATELTKMMATVSRDPCVSLSVLTSQLTPPFSSSRSRSRKTTTTHH